MTKPIRLLVTCEHATNHVPASLRRRVAIPPEILESHCGWDPGTKELARKLARRFDVDLVEGEVSRLIIEMNRSLTHPKLWSEFIRALDREEKDALIERYHRPYRARVMESIEGAIGRGEKLFHLSLHSFTPVFDGVTRNVDIGLLFDPRRAWETRMSRQWQILLQNNLPGSRIRRNQPYRGITDGLTTALRREYPATHYAGVELEVSQHFPLAGGREWTQMQETICRTLLTLLSR